MNRFLLLALLAGVFATPGVAQKARDVKQAIQYIKLANTLRDVDKSQESISLLKRAIPAVQSKDLYWHAVANELIGLSYKDLQDSTNALPYLLEARSQYAKLKYVASAWAVNEVIRDISGKNLYAGIQIGPTDVKVAVFKTKYESDFYEKDIRTKFDVPNATLFADASNAYRSGQDVLKTCLDSIQQYNIPAERIFIVFNSEIKDGLGRTPEELRNLYNQLSRVLPNSSIKIDTTLTAAREAELFTIGAIPRKVWPTTSSLDLGGTNTQGGYFDTKKQFHAIDVPVGTQTLVNLIEGKRSLNPEAFRREAQRVVKAVADTALMRRINASGSGLQSRRTVGMGGAIPEAIVAYLHPDLADLTAVPITMDDMARFKRLVLDEYKALTQTDLSAIGDADTRSKAERNIAAVRNGLTEKQLIAGTLWLDAVMNAYNTTSNPKRFVFVRDADIGWVTGKFLDTISNEYESTIAKGALYTR